MKKYRDHYFHKAKQDQYPARSVYKLQDMDRRFKLFRKGQNVLDLGAAPGSWSLYAARKAGPQGQVLAVDLAHVETAFPDNVLFVQCDIRDPSQRLLTELEHRRPFDLVISDMAPQTTGIKLRDQAQSLELAEQAMAMAQQYMAASGVFVAKVFQGPDVPEFIVNLRQTFQKVKTFKPKSSRAESKESFVLGFGL